MAIKVVKNLVSKLKYGLKCPNPMKAEYITIHNTANDASAANEISYMKNNSSSMSFHFAVDDKQVIQGIPTNRNAWHTGDGTNGTGNRKSIGVEICYSKSGGARYKAAEKLAIKFVAQLFKERGWGTDRVRKHQDWNGKYCPHHILSEGRWNQVKDAIEKELKALGRKTSSSKTSTTKKKTTNSNSKKSSYQLPSGIFKGKSPMMRGVQPWLKFIDVMKCRVILVIKSFSKFCWFIKSQSYFIKAYIFSKLRFFKVLIPVFML